MIARLVRRVLRYPGRVFLVSIVLLGIGIGVGVASAHSTATRLPRPAPAETVPPTSVRPSAIPTGRNAFPAATFPSTDARPGLAPPASAPALGIDAVTSADGVSAALVAVIGDATKVVGSLGVFVATATGVVKGIMVLVGLLRGQPAGRRGRGTKLVSARGRAVQARRKPTVHAVSPDPAEPTQPAEVDSAVP